MPKHNKKVKSDRINELRKQYDTFLEEDKKRKDRNEFILGRLEKMRLGTGPICHKKIAALNESSYPFLQRSEYLNQISFCDGTKSIIKSERFPLPYKTNLEDSNILKEVSKNFILIPKLQPEICNNSNYYKPAVQNIADADWKSKYNILDELKRNEKGEENINVFESNEYHNASKREEPPTLLKCNRSLDDNKDKAKTPEIESNTFQKNNSKGFEKNVDYNENKEKEINTISEGTLQYNKSEECGIPNSKRVEQVETNRQTLDELENKKYGDHNIIKNDIPTTVLPRTTPERTLDHKQLSNEINVSINPQDTHIDFDINNKEDSVLKEHNIQEDKSKEDLQQQMVPLKNSDSEHNIQDDNSKEDLQQQMVPPNNSDSIINKCLETNVENNSTEQYESNNVGNEEFRNEEPNKFEADHETAYPADENNYIQNEENNQNESYIPENQQYTNEYTYFDETEQEQPYTAEIEEHIESTEHFDPAYEQQYINNYEDPGMVQYQDQQYDVENETQEDNNVTYDNNQTDISNYEYINNEAIDQLHHENAYNEINDQNQYENNVQDLIVENEHNTEQEYYEQETVNNIQNQLDADNGFKEKINENIQNIEEQISNVQDNEHVQSENINFIEQN